MNPCHTAKLVQGWFQEHEKGFNVVTWSENTPDFYLIEHLWDVLDKRVKVVLVAQGGLYNITQVVLILCLIIICWPQQPGFWNQIKWTKSVAED